LKAFLIGEEEGFGQRKKNVLSNVVSCSVRERRRGKSDKLEKEYGKERRRKREGKKCTKP